MAETPAEKCCQTCRHWRLGFLAGRPNEYFGHCHAMRILPEGSHTIMRNDTRFHTCAVDQCEPSHWEAKPEPKPKRKAKLEPKPKETDDDETSSNADVPRPGAD